MGRSKSAESPGRRVAPPGHLRHGKARAQFVEELGREAHGESPLAYPTRIAGGQSAAGTDRPRYSQGGCREDGSLRPLYTLVYTIQRHSKSRRSSLGEDDG